MKRVPVVTARDVEICCAEYFNPRRNIVVPNVSWGLGLKYEADLVVLYPSGWADEVEIKVTAADIKADRRKRHNHDSKHFRRLWFAVPPELGDNADIPDRAGILVMKAGAFGVGYSGCDVRRLPKKNEMATKFTAELREKLLVLAHMRVWTLKRRLAEKP